MIGRWLTERRRARLLATPFPAGWGLILAENVRAYRWLDAAEQEHLRDLVQVFVAEKHWEGCNGLVIDDEMRVTIAGCAALLMLGRDHDLMRGVETILVYPSTVVLPERPASFFDGRPRVVGEGTHVLGLAQHRGPVVLAWDSVLRGARNEADGANVVIHEMAHQIDFLDGAADGTPPLPSTAARRAWAEVCSAVYLAVKSGEEHFLRDYAGTNEAEFFAVASEAFFERPKRLAHEIPALYDLLRAFYNLDLAAR